MRGEQGVTVRREKRGKRANKGRGCKRETAEGKRGEEGVKGNPREKRGEATKEEMGRRTERGVKRGMGEGRRGKAGELENKERENAKRNR